MNKSAATNLLALTIAVGGYWSPLYRDIILMTGLFALSGGITNWLAIHLLFEKVPFLYGSGVIPGRFEEFKNAIKNLILQEFFSHAHIERFFQDNTSSSADSINKHIDFERIFEGLTDAIEESPLGGMLGMLGGRQALQPLKEPVTGKLKDIISELVNKLQNKQDIDDLTQSMIDKVEDIIDKRLQDLTPERVKTIIQDMIHEHLGWLVIWGGVFGGLIGLSVSTAEYFW